LFFFKGTTLKDDHPYPSLSVERIIARSSNIGAAKIGIRIGPEKLYSYIRNFGFGTRTGIMLPGEAAGIVHSPKKWDGLAISRIPMGHGVATTPLQTLMAMCAIANDGVLMKPMILSRLVDRNGTVVLRNEPTPVRQVISKEAAKDMVQALKSVISTNGTGAKAAMPFYTVAGKTGTAQKPINGQYVRGKYFSSFIGFFPADNPELCISVVFDEPKRGYYGAETAVPVFRAIAERSARYLAIPVERVPKETLAMIGGTHASH
jgi:cell division protein FtsI/penicillin-binding protein 2